MSFFFTATDLDFVQEIKKADSMGVDITGKTESPILLEEKSTYKFPRVLIEGPVGAPAQDYERFRVAVLVGGGYRFFCLFFLKPSNP